MFIQHITIENFGAIRHYDTELQQGLNIVESRYGAELYEAIGFLVCNGGVSGIPEQWLRDDLLISATIFLEETVYTSEELKGLEDEDNPLDRINNIHALLKLFLDSHSGFLREDIQGYLDLFAFIMNPPFNKLRKVELFLEMAIKRKTQLRYRIFYKRKSDISDDKQP